MNVSMCRVFVAVVKSKNKFLGNIVSWVKMVWIWNVIEGSDGERYMVGMFRDEVIILKVFKGGNIGIMVSKFVKFSNTVG